MSIPTGHLRLQPILRERERGYGGLPEGSHEAAYAVEMVRRRMNPEVKQHNPKPLTIKPKPEPPEPVIPAGTKCCKRGHPQIPDNVRIDRKGNNVCRSCDRERKTPKGDQL